MKQLIKKMSAFLLVAALVAPATLFAQDTKDEKDKKDKKESDQIIITRKGDGDAKTVIEINGDKILVNGKPVDEIKDGSITVRRNKIKDFWAYGGGENGSWNQNFSVLDDMNSNKAMLGVTTEKADKGVEIQTVSEESGAEKAGLKKGDVITKIDDRKIEDPDDLSRAIRDHKPGDKVTVTYSRDSKEQKATAELTKWKGAMIYNFGPNAKGYSYSMPKMNMSLNGLPKVRGQLYNNNWNWSSGDGKLGISVQDTEDGKGVKVLDVDEDGNAAKAGIKEDDIITEVDGKAVNSADEVAKVVKDSKDKGSVKMKVQRGGKTETVDVKIPRKLKTTDL